MAVKAFDGFDNYLGTNDLLQRQGFLQWITGNVVSWRTGLLGYGNCAYLNAPGGLTGSLATPLGTFFMGCRLQSYAGNQFGVTIIDELSGGVQFQVQFYPSGQIVVYRSTGGTQVMIAESGLNSFVPTATNYIEVGGTISSTAGTVTVRVNGQVISGCTCTGVNNQATANASMSGLDIGAGSYLSVDDFYLCDSTTGSGVVPGNTFLGDVKIQTVNTTGNVSVAWSPLANTNWQEVSEVQGDGDSSYNATGTVGATDSFTFGSVTAVTNQIIAVQVMGMYRKDDASTHTVQQQLTSSSTTVEGTTVSIPNTYIFLADLWSADPSTGAGWTPSAVNSLKAGYTLVS